MIYFIPESNLKEFERRMAKLQKRAAKCQSELTCLIDRTVFQDEKWVYIAPDGSKQDRFTRKIQVTVEGDRPKFAGWTFTGTLEHTTEGNVLRLLPEQTAPASYRENPPACDHCRAKRVRKDTYIVRHDNGDYKQVGSSCLRDFLGANSPQTLAAQAENWLSVKELVELAEDKAWQGGTNSCHVERWDLLHFLAHVAAVVRVDGDFMSRAAANRIAEKYNKDAPETTGAKAQRVAWPVYSGHKSVYAAEEVFYARYAATDADKAMAQQAINWVLREYGTGLAEDGDLDEIKEALMHVAPGRELNDFEHNLLVVAKGQSCERRTFGIAAYMIQAYRKANNLIPQREAKIKSQFVGQVGERLRNVRVQVVKVHSWESAFGWQCLIKMLTPDGNVLVWRTGVSDLDKNDEGREYDITGTVKAHTVYGTDNQTVLSRVKAVSVSVQVVPAAAPAPAVEVQPESWQAVQEMAV